MESKKRLAYGVEEAAQALGISRSRMFQAITNGEVLSYKEGRRRMISAHALIAYVQAKEHGAMRTTR